MGNSLLRGQLLSEEEKHCFVTGERYYSAVGQKARTASQDPFWVEEMKAARIAWIEALTRLLAAEAVRKAIKPNTGFDPSVGERRP